MMVTGLINVDLPWLHVANVDVVILLVVALVCLFAVCKLDPEANEPLFDDEDVDEHA